MRTAIIGGGAAGFFLAVNLKEMVPAMEVVVYERSHHLLAKVEVSGGGRCNCTNSFVGISDLKTVYPRGHRLLRRLFHVFDHDDTWQWFTSRGVPLVTQDDHCVFPAAQDSHAIIDCLLGEARRLGVVIKTGHAVTNPQQLTGYDFIAVTTGGMPHRNTQNSLMQWLADEGHEIEPPVPSLFSLSIADQTLKTLMGIVDEEAQVMIPGTHFRAHGPLLVTHWGLSGPAILCLSSHAARFLHERDYKTQLSVNWMGNDAATIGNILEQMVARHPQKMVKTLSPSPLTQRLWAYLVEKTLATKASARWCDLGKKDINRLANAIANDMVMTTGRAPFRDEFVTCGGVSLRSIDLSTLESKSHPNLFFAGEVLDVDGVTGGFNFQAAWTTAFVVAQAIARKATKEEIRL
ncbi:MAG: aminoacetone oxidase family FAD-binding enzyme [Prevotella sp.]|nr:aminoacetone oxidase family FAD-binding enzyme [Prevotella sp.]